MCPTLLHTNPNPILIVDDDQADAHSWAGGVRKCLRDYTVLTANTVTSALDLCRTQKMACVVLDLDMHPDSGFEVLLELVPDRQHRDIPVVILTRLLSRTVQELALEYGAHSCLVKGRTSLEILCRTIESAITPLIASSSSDTTLREQLRLHADFQQRFEALGVSMKDTGILLFLHRHPGTNLRDISDRLGLVASYVEHAVESLMHRRIVTSQPENTNSPMWFITRKGVRLAAELEKLTSDLSRQINQISRARIG